jgi:hypothetical protein
MFIGHQFSISDLRHLYFENSSRPIVNGTFTHRTKNKCNEKHPQESLKALYK